MIESYRCDRCGLVFKDDGFGFQFYSVKPGPRETHYLHLCSECMQGFLGFVETHWNDELVKKG